VRIQAAKGISDWNRYAIVAAIEDAGRSNSHNPELPPHLCPAYEAAWQQMVALGLEKLGSASDPILIRAILSVIAMGKGQFTLGHLAISFTEDELQEMLDKFG
jgi:hypothetical protein